MATQVMQATCPGCKATLRIPTAWANQAMRCKNCSLTFQAKTSQLPNTRHAPPPPPLPGPSARTPAPVPRAVKLPPPPPPPPAAVQVPVPVAAAVPVAPAATAGGTPFDFDGGATDAAPTVRRQRRGRGGFWIGLAMLLALVGVSAGFGVAFYPQIKKAMAEDARRAAKGPNDKEDDPPLQVKPGKGGEQPDKDKTPAKDKDKMPAKDKDKTPPKDGGIVKVTPKDKDKTPAKDKDKMPAKDKDKTPPKDGGTVVKVDPKDKDKDKDKTKVPPVSPGTFPRRALIVSVHNYLYANPVMTGEGTRAIPGAPNRPTGLIPALNRGLNVPMNQIYHVSDAASEKGLVKALPPLKPVIEQSIANFLKTSREQDRVMIFFIGHTREIENEAYLVPLEGDFKDATTLIPVSWVYRQLAECKARQKVLVIDGNRFNAAQGEERPSAGEMGAKFEAALKAPPDGVEVWSACSAAQVGHEFDGAPLGLFLDSFRRALVPEGKGEKGVMEGKIQRQDDLIPLESLNAAVAARMTERLSKRKGAKAQVAFVAGKAPAEGAKYDKDAEVAKEPAFPTFEAKSQQAVREIIEEISLPPVKNSSSAGADLNFSSLPPFSAEALKKYEGKLADDSKLKKAVHGARVALWATSTATPPGSLQAEVVALRTKSKFKDVGSILRDSYTHPGAQENPFKTRVAADSKEMSKVVAALEEALREIEEPDVKAELETAPERGKANYVFVLARLQAQLVYLEEYQSLLGQLRRELPAYDSAVNSGWRMAAKEKPSDSAAKKYFREAKKGYAELAKVHKGTPWEVLGKREELTSLGLEWQAY